MLVRTGKEDVMTSRNDSRILAFIRGFIAGLAIHGTVLFGLQSAKAAWHLLGHMTGTAVVEILMGR
jgi:hypothetical protein